MPIELTPFLSITVKMLEDLRACDGQVNLFKHVFREELKKQGYVTLNSETMPKAIVSGLSLPWLIDQTIEDPALKARIFCNMLATYRLFIIHDLSNHTVLKDRLEHFFRQFIDMDVFDPIRDRNKQNHDFLQDQELRNRLDG
jgi:hypothetical protein